MKEAPFHPQKLGKLPEIFTSNQPKDTLPEQKPQDKNDASSPHSPNEKTKPHFEGHRDRLRNKIMQRGVDALEDYELLETLLFAFIPRRDVKPIAKALLTRFGSLSGVFSAPIKALIGVKGVGERCATYLKTVDALRHRAAREEIAKRPLLASWSAIVQYVKNRLQFEDREHFLVLYIDKKNQLIGDSTHSIGTLDHSPVFPRELTKSILEKGASAVVLVHNHPSGNPMPSRQDIDLTRHIIDILSPFDVTVHDHLIVGRDGVTSLKTAGLI